MERATPPLSPHPEPPEEAVRAVLLRLLDLFAAQTAAVATAVKDAVTLAVHEAVRGVLLEVLTNPALLEKLRGTLTPPPVAIPVPVPPISEPVQSGGSPTS